MYKVMMKSHSECEFLLLLNLHCHATEALPVVHAALASYRAGFSTCAHDVAHFLASCECVSSELRMWLLAHLARRLSERNMVTPPPSAVGASSAQLGIFKTRAILLPAVMTDGVYRDTLRGNRRLHPLISSVVHVNTRGQLWRPWLVRGSRDLTY